MGFAGQVFAARVAVGLAMPSPKAFSQAGAAVGGFASKMYNSLNKKGQAAAKRNLKTAQENLSRAKKQLETHSKSQEAFLGQSAKKAVQSLQGSYKKLGATAMAQASSMKGMKAKLGKATSRKLFANVSKDLKDAKDYEKMMINFTKLQKHERKEVILAIQSSKLKLENSIATEKQRDKMTPKALKGINEEIAILKLQEKEYMHFEKERTNAQEEFHADHKKLTANYVKAEEDVQQALDKTAEKTEHAAEVQQYLQQGVSNFVVELKTGFIEAMRESISVLSAFYYKLNENTQELIEFERELMNANSVFQVTRDELFDTGDTVVQFGQKFGLEMQNGATGLYQLASAGLSAADAMEVLTETLKLSMAVQGDHNTISKLVTQTLFGFEMEMNQAAIVADKFAFAIQKSLIEYQDLASAVKFALPFFTTTGQSIDQLLGALQILTNRALEAGIAGRGLRQGLAELAESIGDDTARFREFGIVVVDANGNMLKLTEIAANFSKVLGEGVINDTELLTTLIEDLNVRGATAFVHLVQASDEFTQAVEDTANAGGQLDEMVRIQNQSISAQIQILRNNIGMMFLYRDATYEGTEYLNAFHEAMVKAVGSLREMLVIEKDGAMVLTEFGLSIQKLAITGVKEMEKILANALPLLEKFVRIGALGVQIFKVYLIPLKLTLAVLDKVGPSMAKVAIAFHLMNKLLPISTLLQWAYFTATIHVNKVDEKHMASAIKNTFVTQGYTSALMTRLFWKKLNNNEDGKGLIMSAYELVASKARAFWELINIDLSMNANIVRASGLKTRMVEWFFDKKRIWYYSLVLPFKSQNAALSIYENTILGIKIILSKVLHGWNMKELTWRQRKLIVDNMSIAQIVKKIAIKAVSIIQDKIEFVLMKLKVAMRAGAFGTEVAWYTLGHRQNQVKAKSITLSIQEAVWEVRKNVVRVLSNALMSVKIALHKIAYPQEVASLNTGLIKHKLEGRSVGLLIKKIALRIWDNAVSKIELIWLQFRVFWAKKAYGAYYKNWTLQEMDNISKTRGIHLLIWDGIVRTKNNMKLALTNKLNAVKLWYANQNYYADLKAIIVNNLKMAVLKIQIMLGYIEADQSFHQLYLDEMSLGARVRLLGTQIQEVFWQGVSNARNAIGNKLKTISTLLTSIMTKKYWEETFAKLTGNSVGLVENIQMKENIFLRIWKSTATIRGTIVQMYNNVVHFLGNTLLLNGWILLTQTLPAKIYDTLVTTWDSIAKWWNTTAVGANTLAKIGSAAITLIAAIALILLTSWTILVTVATWAWTIAMAANPVGLIAIGVIILVAGLVMLAIKLNEQFDLWFQFKILVSHFIAMLLWPFKIIARLFIWIGEKVYGVLEGPLFRLGMFISHFFKMLIYYVKLVGNWFMEKMIRPIASALSWVYNTYLKPYLIDPLVSLFGKIKGFLETLRNPLTVMWHFLRDKILSPIWKFIGIIWGVVKKVVGGIASIVSKGLGYIPGLAEGGYVTPMAEGGMARSPPYLVGEKGPELFVPSTAGKIIPNKDLNTQRVKNMLRDYQAPQAGADKAFQRLASENIVVDSLEVRKANLKQSRVGVDTFGGYI